MFEKEGPNSNLKGRLTSEDNSMNFNQLGKGRSSSTMKKMKNIENLLNNGYEFDGDRGIGIRKTEDKISIKF